MFTRNGCRVLPGMYQRRTSVWEGRGATARPWEAKSWVTDRPTILTIVCFANTILHCVHQ